MHMKNKMALIVLVSCITSSMVIVGSHDGQGVPKVVDFEPSSDIKYTFAAFGIPLAIIAISKGRRFYKEGFSQTQFALKYLNRLNGGFVVPERKVDLTASTVCCNVPTNLVADVIRRGGDDIFGIITQKDPDADVVVFNQPVDEPIKNPCSPAQFGIQGSNGVFNCLVNVVPTEVSDKFDITFEVVKLMPPTIWDYVKGLWHHWREKGCAPIE